MELIVFLLKLEEKKMEEVKERRQQSATGISNDHIVVVVGSLSCVSLFVTPMDW